MPNDMRDAISTISESSSVRLGLVVLLIAGVWNFSRILSELQEETSARYAVIDTKADKALFNIDSLKELVTVRLDTSLAERERRFAGLEARLAILEAEMRLIQSERTK